MCYRSMSLDPSIDALQVFFEVKTFAKWQIFLSRHNMGQGWGLTVSNHHCALLRHTCSAFIRSLFPDDIKADKKGRPTTVGSKIRVSGGIVFSRSPYGTLNTSFNASMH